jgi:hypothetical protein
MSDPTHADLSRQKPLSSLELRFLPLDFVMEWDRCGLAADYFAAHMSHAFDSREAVRALLSTVLNELIENAVKFSSDKSHTASVRMNNFGEVIAFETRNRTDARRADALQVLVRDLEAQSADELFLARIADPAGTAGSPSGLGLLVLKKDYGVRLAIEIEPAADGGFDVWVQAVMRSDALEVR